MAYIGHNRLQVLGAFNGTTSDDIWTVNLNFGGDLRPEYAGPASNGDIAARLTTWWNAWATQLSQGVELTGFKWNAIGPNGRYVFPEQPNEYIFPTPLKGVQTTPQHPSQNAVVMSLYTGKKGKRYRGRIYLPNTQATLNSNWRMVNGHILCADATQALIRGLNTDFGPAPQGHGVCVVASNYGVSTPVTELRAGDIMDTQRRRRNRMPETWYELTI